MKNRIVLFALTLLALMASARAQEGEPISIGKRLTLRSEILQEERAYWVYLPASYADDAYPLQRYPVL